MKSGFISKACIGFIFLYTAVITVSQAQHLRTKEDYIGFTASFGSSASTLTSSYAALNGMKLQLGGASAGLVWGKASIEARLMAGYHFSTGNTPQTVDSYSAITEVRVYPLNLLMNRSLRVQPYVNAGVAASNQKYYGFYASDESQFSNYSVSVAPYVGSILNYSARVGGGLQWVLRNDENFVKLFAEVSYYAPLVQRTSVELKGTTYSNQLACEVGVSVGLNRVKSIFK